MIETIKWDGEKVLVLDQNRLPDHKEYCMCKTVEDVWDAIKTMKIRGAPAIGVAAGFGVALAVNNTKNITDKKGIVDNALKAIDYLATSRPTAVNLFWALERMRVILKVTALENKSLVQRIIDEACSILDEDIMICKKLGAVGAVLLNNDDTVLTHCNAGALATGGYGTALGVIYAAAEQGKHISVYADETRPRLQGARLTAWELMQSGIDVTVICDNMAGSLMKEKKIDIIIVGADRIAANGDAANKIGTYQLAVLAHAHEIPFYIAAPVSTIDFNINSGEEIPIEQRDPDEVTEISGVRITPSRVNVYNPAFDVTPAKYIHGIVTEKGILRTPYKESIGKLNHS